ncbi:hypothetical protein HXA34_20735 [Salipaludibacillus agaradhaerens]|uniref:hypothetical protein n=1 Tax=Salipaludibacillus agaradhaerens TaxID=76935 RepID=UPI0021510A71|nr:hypothetical protein [Salipaludibacillus agaradhaerens]MCR6108727.1 hypothetical protein [Salipaludibacillus agaradhaerens]MCR6120750.1 hypothetical protein [Salipaludibacillus agaradhaerens]
MSIGKTLEKKIRNTNTFKQKQEDHAIYLKQFERSNNIEAYRRDQEKLERAKKARKAIPIN